MILTGTEIERQVVEGDIVIDPFDKDYLNPNSYNYRIGDTIKFTQADCLDPMSSFAWEELVIPESGVVLKPNNIYLASTFEIIGSDNYVTSLIGRSSMGRLGLYLQLSADLGHVGSVHKWTLELHVVQPLRIYKHMKIGQVSFWKINGEKELYSGKYGEMNKPFEFISSSIF